MLKINMQDIHGFVFAMHGMREPYKHTEKSDSRFINRFEEVGPNDWDLADRLSQAGPTHAKYRRMITVWAEIAAPLYWWKEFDTYKVGTVANSESTMHTIAAKEFTLDDFSCEHLMIHTFGESMDSDSIADCAIDHDGNPVLFSPRGFMKMTCNVLNRYRKLYLETKDKKYWWQMIQLLPSSYNQTRTVMLNYEVLSHIYKDRRNHKLDEWHTFCDWIEKLPYAAEMIFPKKEESSRSSEAILEELKAYLSKYEDNDGVKVKYILQILYGEEWYKRKMEKES